MAYCNVNDIGDNADIANVLTAESIINNLAGWNMFYGSGTWDLLNPRIHRAADGTYLLWLERYASEVDSCEIYADGNLRRTISPSLHSASLAVIPADLANTLPFNSIVVTGAYGYAQTIALATGTPLVAGETVLRNHAQVFITEDSHSVGGDHLLQPPEELRYIARTIGRRLKANEDNDEGNVVDPLAELREQIRRLANGH